MHIKQKPGSQEVKGSGFSSPGGGGDAPHCCSTTAIKTTHEEEASPGCDLLLCNMFLQRKMDF